MEVKNSRFFNKLFKCHLYTYFIYQVEIYICMKLIEIPRKRNETICKHRD